MRVAKAGRLLLTFVADGRPVAALSCDDGRLYDWLNESSPAWPAASAVSLREFQRDRLGRQPAPADQF